MSFQGLYAVRDGKNSDVSFVMSTFLRGLYYGDSWFSQIPKDIFMRNYKRVAQAIISSPKNIVKVACLKEDPDVILGYSILSADYRTLHWVYVKAGDKKNPEDSWRKKGIATSLIPPSVQCTTHLTALGKQLMPKIPGCVFDPFNL